MLPLHSTTAVACTLHPCEVIAVSLLLKEAWGLSLEQLRKVRLRSAFKSIAKKGPSWASLCGGMAGNTLRQCPKGQDLTLGTHRVLHIPLHPAILGSVQSRWDSGCLACFCVCCSYRKQAQDCYMVGTTLNVRPIIMAKRNTSFSIQVCLFLLQRIP